MKLKRALRDPYLCNMRSVGAEVKGLGSQGPIFVVSPI